MSLPPQPTAPETQSEEQAAEQPIAAPTHTRLSKRRKARQARPPHCLNCGTPATGNFCAECGQENENQTVALKLLVGDFLSDLASFDSKLLRTLLPLLVRPGFLTNEYNAGKRVRYLSPFKLYLTLSVLFFVVLPLTKRDSLVNFQPDTAQTTASKALQNANTQINTQVNSDDDLKDAKADLKEAAPALTPPHFHGSSKLSFGAEKYDLAHLPPTVAAYDAQQHDPHHAHDSKMMQYLLRQIIKVKQNPQSLSTALMDYIPKMMFVLLPAFALSLKVAYLRSKRLYIEHLIFSLHLHAFVFLLLTLLLVVQATTPHATAAVPIVITAAVLYPYVAMRVVYKQGWIKTFVKYNLLALNYVFLLTFTLIGALAVAFLVV